MDEHQFKALTHRASANLTLTPGKTKLNTLQRPAAYYLQKPLKEWLEQCIEGEIFEEVQKGEPVTWCSPLVVQSKPKFCKMGKKT